MRAEARHVEEGGCIVETHIRWYETPIGREREELEKKLGELGIRFFSIPVTDAPCPPGRR